MCPCVLAQEGLGGIVCSLRWIGALSFYLALSSLIRRTQLFMQLPMRKRPRDKATMLHDDSPRVPTRRLF